MKNLEQYQEELNDGASTFNWGKKISQVIGLWPLSRNDYLFAISISYFTTVLILVNINLYFSLGDFAKVIENLTENLATIHMFVRTLMLRVHIGKLRFVISESLEDYKASSYRNAKEIEIFMSQVRKGRTFAKVVITFISVTEVTWYLQPVMNPPPPVDNATMQFVLPFHFHVFYEMNDFKTYVLTYISQGGYIIISGVGHCAADWFLITLVFHLCGRLSVLTERINSLKDNPKEYRKELNSIIIEHTRLLKMGRSIRTAYATGLFVYLFNGTLLLCIIGYLILINIITGPDSDLLQFFIYILATYFIIIVFCIVSEHLVTQSTRVGEAYWNCEWYDMSKDCIKDITYCIHRSQSPLALQAGKFSFFGHNTTTDVTRTAMGYLSILRNFLLIE